MKRPATIANLLAVFVLAAWLALPSGAQAPPAQASPSKPAAASKKPAKKAKAAKEETPAATAATEEAPVRKRDPFQPLVSKQQATGVAPNLPPGKAGLQISTVKIDGTVRAPSGMIAVVSNPQQRVYFLHEGDRVYDGRVEKIGLDAVTFLQTEKDAFGKVIDRLVTKRIYPSAGEQQ
jgi:Tfp pilus assembly protein PilP